MKKYLYILIVVVLAVSISACGGGETAATAAPADGAAPVDSGESADAGAPADAAAATDAPADDSGVPDEMDGFLFVPMQGEYQPSVDVNYFVAILREQSGIAGDLQLISAVPATTAWDTVRAYYEQEAKNNGWVLEKTEDVKTQKGYLCSVALFTHGKNKILISYYPLNGEVIILQVQGQ